MNMNLIYELQGGRDNACCKTFIYGLDVSYASTYNFRSNGYQN